MSKVLSALFFRIKKQTIFWILLALLVGLTLLDFYTYKAVIDSYQNLGVSAYIGELYSVAIFPIASATSYSVILSVIFVVLFFGADFSDGFIRNVVMSNKGRGQIFFSYFIITALVSLVFVATQTLVAVLCLALANGFKDVMLAEASTGIFSALAIGFVSCLGMSTLTLFSLMLFRKKTPTLIISLIVVIVLSPIVQVFVALLEFVSEVSFDYEWIPFIQQTLFDPLHRNVELLAKIICVNTVLSAAFTVGGYFVFKHSQLK